jgi:hypothetical protein
LAAKATFPCCKEARRLPNFSLTAEQMRERVIESGELSADRLDEALGLLKSPDFWAFDGAGVSVWGQRQN